MVSYSIAQFMKYRGRHDIDIIVIDNSYPDKSIDYLIPFEEVMVLENRSKLISSHGVALDMAMRIVNNEWVICAESDSFPTSTKFLDDCEEIVKAGYDGAGSLLSLSGGRYKHPCGALYKKSIWEEAKEYFSNIPYNYYPNFMMRDNFAVHTMIHKAWVDRVSDNPDDWVELSPEYKGDVKKIMKEKLTYYKPIGTGVFHNGMGGKQETLMTYGRRTEELDSPFIILNEKSPKIIGRLGYEPGQAFHYYEVATGRKLHYVPTETNWLPGKENQQQERTVMNNGFTHLWAGSSFLSMKGTAMNDIYEIKNKIIQDLYNSLPKHQKID
jgi:hypothetical protein